MSKAPVSSWRDREAARSLVAPISERGRNRHQSPTLPSCNPMTHVIKTDKKRTEKLEAMDDTPNPTLGNPWDRMKIVEPETFDPDSMEYFVWKATEENFERLKKALTEFASRSSQEVTDKIETAMKQAVLDPPAERRVGNPMQDCMTRAGFGSIEQRDENIKNILSLLESEGYEDPRDKHIDSLLDVIIAKSYQDGSHTIGKWMRKTDDDIASQERGCIAMRATIARMEVRMKDQANQIERLQRQLKTQEKNRSRSRSSRPRTEFPGQTRSVHQGSDIFDVFRD
ncbi:hypothetical protein F4678DRAFT_478698 [Xylaria arbuscula]|nr:hypothetical protein F4678DRAFT_478698 [Xylaria arbuscula]